MLNFKPTIIRLAVGEVGATVRVNARLYEMINIIFLLSILKLIGTVVVLLTPLLILIFVNGANLLTDARWGQVKVLFNGCHVL